MGVEVLPISIQSQDVDWLFPVRNPGKKVKFTNLVRRSRSTGEN